MQLSFHRQNAAEEGAVSRTTNMAATRVTTRGFCLRRKLTSCLLPLGSSLFVCHVSTCLQLSDTTQMPPPPPSPWPHYAWAAGHVLLLICSARYLLGVITFKAGAMGWWYKSSYAGALISYSIVCYKALGVPQANMAFAQRAFMDENVQYFILAVFWFFTRPVFPSLIPFATFSLFHTLTFARTNILTKIFPSKPGPIGPNGQPGRPEQHPVAKAVGTWVKKNYETAMKAVASIELGIFAWVIFGAVIRRNSLLTPVIYAHFLRQRFHFSQFTRSAVLSISAQVDARVNQPNIPPYAKSAWAFIKAGTQRWAGGPMGAPVPQGGPAAAQGGGPAGPRPAGR